MKKILFILLLFCTISIFAQEQNSEIQQEEISVLKQNVEIKGRRNFNNWAKQNNYITDF